MDTITESVTNGSLFELLHTYDLVLCCKSVEEVMVVYEKWNEALKGKGLHIKD